VPDVLGLRVSVAHIATAVPLFGNTSFVPGPKPAHPQAGRLARGGAFVVLGLVVGSVLNNVVANSISSNFPVAGPAVLAGAWLLIYVVWWLRKRVAADPPIHRLTVHFLLGVAFTLARENDLATLGNFDERQQRQDGRWRPNDQRLASGLAKPSNRKVTWAKQGSLADTGQPHRIALEEP
jgi:hypothetical protein